MKLNTNSLRPVKAGEEIIFLNNNGAETIFCVCDSMLTEYGNFVEVFEVVVDIYKEINGRVLKICDQGSFAIKRFYLESDAAKAHKQYLFLRKGERTPKMYRRSKDGSDIVMKNLNVGNKRAVSANNESLTLNYFQKNPIGEIVNWESFLKKFYQKAYVAGFVAKYIPLDMYFFIVNEFQPQKVSIEVVAWDLDNFNSLPPHACLPVKNLELARNAAIDFVKRCVKSQQKDFYIHIAEQMFIELENNYEYTSGKIYEC